MGRKTVRRAVLAFALLALAACVTFAWLHRKSLVAWYRLQREFEHAGRNEQGYAEYRHRVTGIVFVRVPGGTFLMGSPEDEKDREGDEHQHRARVGPFLIAKHEVSQEVWQKLMGISSLGPADPGFPMVSVTWDECREFCLRAGLRLPTEAEWEYACRAGTQTAYAFGDTVNPTQANFGGSLSNLGPGGTGIRVGGPVQVAACAPNGFGLINMPGNVWEWCEDVFDESFYSSPAASETDPIATRGSPFRVTRGGGWSGQMWRCRSANRDRAAPDFRSPDLGFRPVFPLH